jgi:hypothetical protein
MHGSNGKPFNGTIISLLQKMHQSSSLSTLPSAHDILKKVARNLKVNFYIQ